jgi:hypothetical protein
LGFGLSKTKAYFASMPDKIAKEATDARNDPEFQKRAAEFLSKQQTGAADIPVAASTQKPWFSSWFRSNPTAEEIFDKYEKETLIQGKSSNPQSIFLKGKVSIEPMIDATKPTFTKTNNRRTVNMKADFEMSTKSPKILVKMKINAKQDGSTLFMESHVNAEFIGGFNGVYKWSVMYVKNGDEDDTKIEGGNDDTNGFSKALENTDDFIFKRRAYRKIQFTANEIIENRMSYLVTAYKNDGDYDLLYFDTETGLITKLITKKDTITVSNHTMFGSIKMPSAVQIVSEDIPETLIKMDISEMKSDVPLDDSIFLRSSYK